MEDYPKSLLFHEKALEIYDKTLPSHHLLLETRYNNIGSIHDNLGQHKEALAFYEKSLEILKKTLPSSHPSLATAYSNIGSMYDSLEEYSKALILFIRNHWKTSKKRCLRIILCWVSLTTKLVRSIMSRMNYQNRLSSIKKYLKLMKTRFHPLILC